MRNSVAIILVLLLFSGAMLMACEDTVDPIVDSDRQLTLWGTLDMNSDVQFIRVVPIREILDVRVASNPDLEVISIDLDTGTVTEWQDSNVVFTGDRPALLYYADLKVIPEHTYRIEVRSPDYAKVTSVETTLPPLPEVEIDPEDVIKYVSGTGFVVSGTQHLTWHGIQRPPYEIEQWYRFLEFGNLGFIDYPLSYVPSLIKYDQRAQEIDMTLNLVRQRDSIQKYIAIGAVRLVGLGQTVTMLNDALFPPGGVFDAELLAQPGTMSNVENGFGFVGSVGRFSIEWVIDDSSAALMGYTPLSGFRIPVLGKNGLQTATLKNHPWDEDADR